MTDSYSRRSGKHSATIRKNGGNVVTYFCTPEGRVLHFLVGPVNAAKMLESAEWSQLAYEQLTELEKDGLTVEQRLHWMAGEHGDQLARDKDVLGKVTKWLSGVPGARSAVEGTQADLDFSKVLQALKTTVGDDGHQLLQDKPLPLLKEIEAPVFEVLAGQSFSRRASQLQERVLDNVKEGRPTLLMVANLSRVPWHPGWDEADVAKRSEPNVQQSLPKHTRVQSQLPAYHAEVLSAGELTMVVAGLDLPPIKLPYGARPRFVILDRQGKVASVLTNKHSIGVLARMMEKYSADERDSTSLQVNTESPRFSKEQLARSDFRLAESLLSKRPEKARERLKKIVAQYPDTETASSALSLLAQGDK